MKGGFSPFCHPLTTSLGVFYQYGKKICGVCFSRAYPFKCFKGCLPQILFGPFLSTFCHLLITNNWLVSTLKQSFPLLIIFPLAWTHSRSYTTNKEQKKIKKQEIQDIFIKTNMIWLLMMILAICIEEKLLMKYYTIRAFNIAKSPKFDGY